MQYVIVGLIASSAMLLNGCAAIISATHAGAAAIAAQGAAATFAVGAGAGAVVGLAAPEVYKALKSAEDGQSAEQAPGSTQSLGARLANNQAEVRTLTQRAMQAQREVLVVAGMRVQNAITRGRAAFKQSLSLSVSALGEKEKKFQAEIQTLVADLYSPVDMRVKGAGDRAQAIAYGLRSADAVPLLNASGPIFLFPFTPFQSINVSGNFPASSNSEAVPQLLIDGKTYKAVDYGSDRLTFSVPTADLNAAEPTEIVWKNGIVSVPWTPSSGFFSSPEIEQMRIEMGILPHSFGRMSIEHRTTRLRTEEKIAHSNEFSLTTANSGESSRQCLELTPQELEAGWKFRPGTSAFVPVGSSTGLQSMDEWKEWTLSLVSETTQTICWRASAAHSTDASPANPGLVPASKKTGWKISATQWREVKEPGVTSEKVDLAWGSKHYFQYPAGTWKLRYVRTGAGATELSAAEESHPLIRVSTDASGVSVNIYPF